MLLADHGLYRLEADLRWIDHTAARLDVISPGGAPVSARYDTTGSGAAVSGRQERIIEARGW